MKSKLLVSAAIALVVSSSQANAEESINQKIDRLEQEIQLLKRQNEVSEEKQKAAAEKAATVEYGEKGLTITSPDKSASIKIKGYAQADSRSFLDNSNTSNVDQFLLRTARVSIDGKFQDDFGGKLTYDFGNNNPKLVDAYVDYKADPALNIRLGKFKAPIGLERLQSETEISAIERGLTANLTPSRDVGIQVSGEVIPQTLEYQLALTNGAASGADSSTDIDGPKDVVARIFAHPFRESDFASLQGFGVGVAGSFGQRDGTTAAGNSNLTSGYKSEGQGTIFSYNPAAGTSYSNGDNWRINPEAYYYNGSLGLLSEYVLETQEVTNVAKTQKLQNDAWSAQASYVITGEDASYEGVKPEENFSPSKGNWGAFEVLGRIGKLDIDNDTFPTFANPNSSVSSAFEKTIGFNWYLNNNLKFNTAYTETSFDGGAAAGADRETEKLIGTRAQFKF